MTTKILADDLDNCLINFDRKILVTNLLDKYGGLLEETAKTVQEFLSSEEEKGKQFEKTFLVHGREENSQNEVIILVPERKLNPEKERLRDVHCMLYSAETVGGSKSPPTEFIPLKQKAIKLDSLVVKDAKEVSVPVNGSTPVVDREEKHQPTKKSGGALGAMFKKQETTAAAAKKSPEKSPPKKSEPEKKADKSGALGAMFKKQEATASKKNSKSEPEKINNALGAMFKKQEATTAAKKSPPADKDKEESSKISTKATKGLTNFLTKKEDKKTQKSPATKKEEIQKIKEEPAGNVSVNLFEESSSSDDEEALDALKRQILTDDEDESKPTTSNKRRRIIESDDEDTGPEVKVECREVEPEEAEDMEVSEDDEPKKSQTFLDEDGFIVTKKPKNKGKPARKPNPTPVKMKTPVKLKKESPKSPANKKAAQSKTPAPKTKQGNIMNFFTKK